MRQLPVWQQFISSELTGTRSHFLSVAVDVDPERRAAIRGAACPTHSPPLSISAGVLGRAVRLRRGPQRHLLDEQGIIRFVHIGGFDVRRPEIAQPGDALLRERFRREKRRAWSQQEALDLELLRAEIAAHPDEAALHFALGRRAAARRPRRRR